jgi:hypothetical protein
MLDHIFSLDELEVEASQIDGYLQITCGDDPNEAVEVGNTLVVYLARTGKMLAGAKFHQDEAIKNNTLAEIGMKRNISPTIMKKLIEASTKRENYLVNWIERLNRACTHKIEWLRTLISKAKTEMQYQNFSNQ